jgi:hypothetical protein
MCRVMYDCLVWIIKHVEEENTRLEQNNDDPSASLSHSKHQRVALPKIELREGALVVEDPSSREVDPHLGQREARLGRLLDLFAKLADGRLEAHRREVNDRAVKLGSTLNVRGELELDRYREGVGSEPSVLLWKA